MFILNSRDTRAAAQIKNAMIDLLLYIYRFFPL